jgi:hypothetical protein
MTYLARFYTGYIEAALFCGVDDKDQPLDANYTTDDISAESSARMKEQCEKFVTSPEVASLLEASGLSPEYAGHDFWLTRNHHGAGYWDRDLGEIGDALTKLAHERGERTMYVGDDGMIHIG